jgi:hypothetical protein
VDGLLRKTEEAPTEVAARIGSLFDGFKKQVTDATEGLAAEMARLRAFPEQIASGIEKGFDAQLQALHRALQSQLQTVTSATGLFVDNSGKLQESFAAILNEVVRQFATSVDAVKNLPRETQERSTALAETYRLALEAQHEAMLGEVQRIGTIVLRENVDTLKQSAADLARIARLVEEKRSDILAGEREAVREAIASCFMDIRNFIERYRETFRGAETQLPAELETLHTTLISRSAEAAQAVSAAAGVLGPETRSLGEAAQSIAGSTLDLRNAMAELAGSMSNSIEVLKTLNARAEEIKPEMPAQTVEPGPLPGTAPPPEDRRDGRDRASFFKRLFGGR